MRTLDCFGEFCPIPIIKIKNTLAEIEANQSFMVITDHSCVAESINEFLGRKKVTYVIDEVMNGVWEIIITKL